MNRFACVSTLLLVVASMAALWCSGCPRTEAQVPAPISIPTNRYLIYWAVDGNYQACLETNAYTIKDGNITFRVDGVREAIRWEKIGMGVTLAPPWGLVDTRAAVERTPAEVSP